MTRLLVLAALLCATVASAGVFEVVCVAPADDNDGSCDSVVAVPRTGPLVIHLTWRSVVRGGASGHDSLTVASGDTLAFVKWLPGGMYYTTLWAEDEGGRGCPFDTVRTVRSWPGRVKVLK